MKTLDNRIHDANIALHDKEAKYYDMIHYDIFNIHEQDRIITVLNRIDELIMDNRGKALDFGAGTGNLTGKLLDLGYEVTAIDISSQMCDILQMKYRDFLVDGRLKVVHSKIEDAQFEGGLFDLIACYSVLHHLPDYIDVIRGLSFYLKNGGVMYLDYEYSPSFWDENTRNKMFKYFYYNSVRALNFLTGLFQLRDKWSFIRSFDYSPSDFWTKKEHHIDHDKIGSLFDELNFSRFYREDYFPHRTKLLNPMYYLYKHVCEPDKSLWIANK